MALVYWIYILSGLFYVTPVGSLSEEILWGLKGE